MAMTLSQQLSTGIDLRDSAGRLVRYRYLAPNDDFGALTELLHDAYRPLAAAGMRFVASHQPVDVTRQRALDGDTVLALIENRIVGTVTLSPATKTGGSPFYERSDAANIGQFAVSPAMQQRRIGSMLMDMAEERARDMAFAQVVLNTSEHAGRLIRFYARRGYRFVEYTQWADVNYRSVVMAKAL